ncbi:MAG TPA: hypothetical protein VEA77_07835 [Hyphomicrobium sp.]|nr:hypothetical protein [Hyphomicrobium sp.]
MKIAAFALTAALLGLASVTPASAVSPSAVGHATTQTDGVTLVAKKVIVKKNVYKKNVFRHRAGGRYKHAPNGWHRHDHRPGDWHTRGCIVVGPIWYCP